MAEEDGGSSSLEEVATCAWVAACGGVALATKTSMAAQVLVEVARSHLSYVLSLLQKTILVRIELSREIRRKLTDIESHRELRHIAPWEEVLPDPKQLDQRFLQSVVSLSESLFEQDLKLPLDKSNVTLAYWTLENTINEVELGKSLIRT